MTCAGRARLTLTGIGILWLGGLWAGAALLVPALLAQTPATPPQKPIFRSSVEYIEVDVRVVDGKNAPVRDLKKEDFHLLEDGKEQAIETFSAIDVPIESAATLNLGDTMRVEPDVSANHYSAADSRVYVILLDDRQIDAHRTQNTIAIVKDFIQRKLGPNDLTAIVSSSGRTDISQALTSNKTLLLKAVDGFMGRKLESAAVLSANGVQPASDRLERFHEASASLDAIESVVSWMGQLRGRSKVLLLVSEGTDYNTDAVLDDPMAVMMLELQRQATAAAQRANVTVYGIDPRGLYAFEELTGVSANISKAFRLEVDRERMSLRAIAADTGGAVSFQNDFETVLDRIVAQHSTYYLLGYYPKNARRDGKTRSIDVRVNGKGLKVTARSGYREADAKTPAPAPPLGGLTGASADLREALNSPLPLDGLPLMATAAAFRTADGKASVAVILETSDIDVVEQDGRLGFEMTAVAIDGHNKTTTGLTTKMGLQASREASDRIKEQGFRAMAKLDGLGPGRYQVRAVLAATGSARRGSIWYDVDVPDFSSGDLATSGLVIASKHESTTPTGNPSKLFADALSTSATAVRDFKAGDELTAFMEVYANRSPAIEASLTATIRNEHGDVALRRTDAISSGDFMLGNGVFRWITELPLAELPAGRYVLTLEMTPKTGNAKPIVRTVPFRIVEAR